MKRVGMFGGLLFAALLALISIGASTAVARCAMSTQNVGNFKEISDSGDCINESIFRTQLYVIVDNLTEVSLGEGVDCAQDAETVVGYGTNSCSGEQQEGANKWVKVRAPGWDVNGTLLSGSAKLATTAAVMENGKLTFGETTIECTGSSLDETSPQIQSPNKESAASLTFTSCSATAGSACKLTGQPISIGAAPVSAEASEKTEDTLLFAPKTKTVFATIKLEGEKCSLSGVNPITGHASAVLPEGHQELTSQELVANTASGELKVGLSAASLKGKALLKLESGETWSFDS